jgi:hypothetical protein
MAIRPDQRSGLGTWRGSPPMKGGTGSGAGPRGLTTTGTGPRIGSAGFNPTVINLLVLVALEIGAYMALRYAFKTAHGG